MSGSSLECYQLVLLSLRLLPSFFLICFGTVLLLFRTHIGFSKTKLDLMAQSLSNDYASINGVQIDNPLFWVTLALIFFLLTIAVLLMLLVVLQLAGVETPAFLMQFYPNYTSHKLKRQRAANDTSSLIYTVGSVSFVVSLALGLCICLSSRREITQTKKSNLAESIRSAMLVYKLSPWKGVNATRLLDQIQTSFQCCGLNSYYDYALEPRKKGVSWERHFHDRSFAAVASGLKEGNHLVALPAAQSCCLKDDTGNLRNCSDSDRRVVDAGAVAGGVDDSGGMSSSSAVVKLHRVGCYARVLQYIETRQAEAEHWSFVIGACIAAMGSMAYWAQAM